MAYASDQLSAGAFISAAPVNIAATAVFLAAVEPVGVRIRKRIATLKRRRR